MRAKKYPTLQFGIQTLLIATLAFALGFIARNMTLGLKPWFVQMTVPSSATPIEPGDWVYVESNMHPGYSRRVRVLSDGTIALRGVGDINVSGQDIRQIQATVRKRYQEHFKHQGDSHSRSFEVFRADASQPIH